MLCFPHQCSLPPPSLFKQPKKNTHKHNLPRQRSNLSQDQGTPRDLVPKIRFSKAWHKPMPLRPAILRWHRTVGLANLVVVNPGDGEKLDTLQGMDTYPTKREVRKIIDSKCHFWGICDRSLEGINLEAR